MNASELPPLTPEETRDVLRRLGDLTAKIVLVGGQALAFWADRYANRFTLPGPVNSKDIDFAGTQDSVAIAAVRLRGVAKVPDPFADTPNTGIVEFQDHAGRERWIDFLGELYGQGLDFTAIMGMAIGVDVDDGGPTASFLVMHPVHCLESRISNLGGLAAIYDSPLGRDQARASILCAREYLHDRLGDDGGVRTLLDLNERIYRFAYANSMRRRSSCNAS